VVQRGTVVFVNIDDRISSHNNRKNVIWYVFGLLKWYHFHICILGSFSKKKQPKKDVESGVDNAAFEK
jgi:hypothetical protein